MAILGEFQTSCQTDAPSDRYSTTALEAEILNVNATYDPSRKLHATTTANETAQQKAPTEASNRLTPCAATPTECQSEKPSV